jgi:RNA polymerase sigma-70 factor (ECF subfamily)
MSQHEFWAESFRDYLHVLGLAQLDKDLIDKVDLSGVVQTTMLEAFQHTAAVPVDELEQRIWLRRLFMNNLLDSLRKLRTQKRDVGSEVPLDRPIGNSELRLQASLASDASTPSVKAMKNEQADLLLRAIADLPAVQRQAIELHHLQSLSLEEISCRMERPKGAVAALIYRGMQALRANGSLQE